MSELDGQITICKWLATCNKTDVDGFCLLYRDFMVCPLSCPMKEEGTAVNLEILIAEGFNPYCKHIEFYPKHKQYPDISCSQFHIANPKCLEQCQFSEKVQPLTSFFEEGLY